MMRRPEARGIVLLRLVGLLWGTRIVVEGDLRRLLPVPELPLADADADAGARSSEGW